MLITTLANRGHKINIGELSYRKAAEKKSIPDNFDNVVRSKQEKKESGHEADSCCLAGADVKEVSKINGQTAKGHGSSALSLSSPLDRDSRSGIYRGRYRKSNCSSSSGMGRCLSQVTRLDTGRAEQPI